MHLDELLTLLREVQRLGFEEFLLEWGNLRLEIRTTKRVSPAEPHPTAPDQITEALTPSKAPTQPPPETPATQAPEKQTPETLTPEEAEKQGYYVLKSPMVGTFYRRPAPDKPPFVQVGDTVKKGQTLCLIEAMKIFNEIESEVDGKIIQILVEDGTPVEFGQPLFIIEPLST